jgi:hypothetical protein
MLRPVRSVRVTTKEELDAALATADQVVVEGDDELLSYAVNKASGDSENQVSVETGKTSELRTHDEGDKSAEDFEALLSREFGPQLGQREIRSHALSERGFGDWGRRWELIAVSVLAMLLVIVGGLGWLWRTVDLSLLASLGTIASLSGIAIGTVVLLVRPVIGRAAGVPASQRAPILRFIAIGAFGIGALGIVAWLVSSLLSGPTVTAGQGGVAAGREISGNTVTVAPQPPPIAPVNDFWANLPSLLWPLVAIVAIVALFLIAWKAIGSGSNVTIQWKVTENVSGRLVITKIRERAPRERRAA